MWVHNSPYISKVLGAKATLELAILSNILLWCLRMRKKLSLSYHPIRSNICSRIGFVFSHCSFLDLVPHCMKITESPIVMSNFIPWVCIKLSPIHNAQYSAWLFVPCHIPHVDFSSLCSSKVWEYPSYSCHPYFCLDIHHNQSRHLFSTNVCDIDECVTLTTTC